MASSSKESNQEFTFSYFDATRTDGYASAAASTTELVRSNNAGGLFTNEEEDEDIVARIRLRQASKPKKSAQGSTERFVGNQDLFAALPRDEKSQSASKPNAPPSKDSIKLDRLLNDYMLGAKGDSIIDQMEDLTIEKPNAAQPERAPIPNAVSSKEVDNLQLDDALSPDLMSMTDFEKYISEN